MKDLSNDQLLRALAEAVREDKCNVAALAMEAMKRTEPPKPTRGEEVAGDMVSILGTSGRIQIEGGNREGGAMACTVLPHVESFLVTAQAIHDMIAHAIDTACAVAVREERARCIAAVERTIQARGVEEHSVVWDFLACVRFGIENP